MSTDGITPGCVVHVPAVLGHPEWTDVLATVVRIEYRHGIAWVRLRVWPCGAFPEMDSTTTIRMDAVEFVCGPVPEVAGGEQR